MTDMLEFDAETARRIERTYRTPDVVAQRRTVLAALRLRPGERVLDVGCGPGLLVADMAAQVGPDGVVTGVDPSESMLSLARGQAVPAGGGAVELRRASVHELPGADQSVDVAVSTQVLEYVEDLAAALAEIRRVLVPGGRLVVLDTDWDSVVWHSRDRARMARVLDAWDQHLDDPYLPRTLAGRLRRAGFEVMSTSVVPILNVGFRDETYSAGLLDTVAAYVVGRAGLTEGDVDAWASDLRALGDDYFFSLNRYLFTARRSR